MTYLVVMTIVWAFSFSLIGVYLAGQVDAYFSVLIRVLLATIVFLPFIRPIPVKLTAKLIALGATQLGGMYVFYYQSFLLLTVPEVLIFTVLTPIYVTLIFDVMQGSFNLRCLLTAILAVWGAVIMRYSAIGKMFLLILSWFKGETSASLLDRLIQNRSRPGRIEIAAALIVWIFLSRCFGCCNDNVVSVR